MMDTFGKHVYFLRLQEFEKDNRQSISADGFVLPYAMDSEQMNGSCYICPGRGKAVNDLAADHLPVKKEMKCNVYNIIIGLDGDREGKNGYGFAAGHEGSFAQGCQIGILYSQHLKFKWKIKVNLGFLGKLWIDLSRLKW